MHNKLNIVEPAFLVGRTHGRAILLRRILVIFTAGVNPHPFPDISS